MRACLAACLLALAALLCLPQPGRAQTELPGGISQDLFRDWQTLASRVEDSVDAGAASEQAFDDLRAELVEWRQRFAEAQSVNTAAIRTVQAQLESLPPAPAEGEEEPEATAAQRAELRERLATLQSPQQEAELAYSRADALIRAIDATIRERQASALLELGPSPLNPVIWPEAAAALTSTFAGIWTDATEAWRDPGARANFRQNLPITVLLAGFALLLVARGRLWIERLAFAVERRKPSAERWLVAFLLSLGQIVLPVGGLILLAAAAESTGLVGPRGEALLDAVPAGGFFLFFTRWLGGRIFPGPDPEAGPDAALGSESGDRDLSLTPLQQREGRLYATLLGAVLFLKQVFDAALGIDNWRPEVANVVIFPLIVLAGVMIWRLSRFLRIHARSGSDEDDGAFRRRLSGVLAQLLAAFAVAGPLLAAVGYVRAGQAIIFPTIQTLQLIALLVVLQRLIDEFYVLFTRNRDGVADALAPTLLGFLTVLASLPLLALIWGARVTDLTEIWARFQAGFAIGSTRISPSDFLTFIIVFAIGFVLTRIFQAGMKTTVLPKTKLDLGGRNAVSSGLGYLGIFLSALTAITMAGIDLSSLAIVAGALSVGIGFGLQTIVSNFVSGIILLVERPISEGDWIQVGDEMGFVRDISVRATRIETFDRRDVIVPNADLVSGVVTNWTRGNLVGRLVVPVGVAYGSDTRKVARVLTEVAEAQPLVVLNPPPQVLFLAFGASSLNFEVRLILRDVTQILVVQNELHHEIARRFAEEGIEIPFSQHDLWLRNPESLRGVADPERQTKTGTPPRAQDIDDIPEPEDT